MTFVDLMTMQLGGSRKMLVDAQMHMFLIANVYLDKVIHARNNLKDQFDLVLASLGQKYSFYPKITFWNLNFPKKF